MIFRFLGQVVRRGWPVLLAGWAILLLVSWLIAPPWSSVTQDQELAFLPPDVPSRRAQEQFTKAFPAEQAGGNLVLVLHRTETSPAIFDEDLQFISNVLEPKIRQLAEDEGGLAYEIKSSNEPLFSDDNAPPAPPPERSIIARIQTPNTPGTGSLLVSSERRAMLVVVDLVPQYSSSKNGPVIDKIAALVRQLRDEKKLPAGLDIAITGSAVIGRDHSVAELKSVRITGLLTVVLVAVLLILIYRAPLLAIIPLLTVYLAVQISLNVLALLAQSGYLMLFQGLQIYISILAYGAGVDYCLFLTARYKEELDRGLSPQEAVSRAVSDVGTALAASAATVMFGIAMMMFAEFGKFRDAGFAIPLSLLLVLFATLTFSPALLCLAGRWAFWPWPLRNSKPRAGGNVSGREKLAPLGGFTARLERFWVWVGELLLRRAGTVWLCTVALMAPFAIVAVFLYNHISYDMIGDLPANASSTAGTRLLEQHFPAGIIGTVSVLIVDPHVDFRKAEGHSLIESVTERLRSQKQQLGLADVRSLTAPLGITSAATHDFSGIDIPAEARQQEIEHAARNYYLTDMGGRGRTGTRLELILNQSPFTRQSMDNVGRLEQAIRAALPEDARQDCQLYVIGTTATVHDLSDVMQRDRRRIELLVMGAVFLILILLLRRFMVTVYLLGSVLFSYFTTMGVTFALFWLLDPHGFSGIDWKVAIFLFTILIAVGEDYNIFLMTRVQEEQRRFGPLRGITEALDRTGPIISSCSIIMAGTFGSLLFGTLTEMKQLGFALAFGVLLDTFVVRPILVPAFLILVQTGRLPFTGGKQPDTGILAEKTSAEQATPAH